MYFKFLKYLYDRGKKLANFYTYILFLSFNFGTY